MGGTGEEPEGGEQLSLDASKKFLLSAQMYLKHSKVSLPLGFLQSSPFHVISLIYSLYSFSGNSLLKECRVDLE